MVQVKCTALVVGLRVLGDGNIREDKGCCGHWTNLLFQECSNVPEEKSLSTGNYLLSGLIKETPIIKLGIVVSEMVASNSQNHRNEFKLTNDYSVSLFLPELRLTSFAQISVSCYQDFDMNNNILQDDLQPRFNVHDIKTLLKKNLCTCICLLWNEMHSGKHFQLHSTPCFALGIVDEYLWENNPDLMFRSTEIDQLQNIFHKFVETHENCDYSNMNDVSVGISGLRDSNTIHSSNNFYKIFNSSTISIVPLRSIGKSKFRRRSFRIRIVSSEK